MIDVGYNHQAYGEVLATSYGVRNWQPPQAVLAECGVSPAEVSSIFITHAHFDHMGNIEAVPERDVLHPGARAVEVGVGAVARAAVPLADARHGSGGHHEGRRSRAAGPARVRGRRPRQRAAGHRPARGLRHAHLGIDVRARPQRPPARSRPTRGCSPATSRTRHENLRGTDPKDPQYIPVGLATGSQFNLIMAAEEMVKKAGGDPHRVIPVHEERLQYLFPSRITKAGLRITEIALADGEASRVCDSLTSEHPGKVRAHHGLDPGPRACRGAAVCGGRMPRRPEWLRERR